MSELNTDIIYHVLAPTCSLSVIYKTLDRFLPQRKSLNLDYANSPNGKDFFSEREMVSHFLDSDHSGQTFYWNAKVLDPKAPMVGMDITADKKLIVTITVKTPEENIEEYFQGLRTFLDSNVGVVSYHVLADYSDGRDFERRYDLECCT